MFFAVFYDIINIVKKYYNPYNTFTLILTNYKSKYKSF